MSDSLDKHTSESYDLPLVGRFAPSPSGRMHVGNLLSFMIAYIRAYKSGGYCMLRIEDLDPSRSKQCFIDQIMRDLEWFGFQWSGEVVFQSRRTSAYEEAFEELKEKHLIYPCFCTRADLHAAQAPHSGEEFIYQGTCKNLTRLEIEEKARVRNPAYRLIVNNEKVTICDVFQSISTSVLSESSGDFIIKRSDGVFAYQLAVVVDDAYQGVTDVCRGVDLLPSSFRQQYLQNLLGYSHVSYAHVPLFVDSLGRRLSKRNNDASLDYLINHLRLTSNQIIGYIAYSARLIDAWESLSLDDLVNECSLDSLQNKTQLVWTSPKLSV